MINLIFGFELTNVQLFAHVKTVLSLCPNHIMKQSVSLGSAVNSIRLSTHFPVSVILFHSRNCLGLHRRHRWTQEDANNGDNEIQKLLYAPW